MSWKTIKTETRQYTANLIGTPEQWKKKLDDIEARNHEILKQGNEPYRGELMDGGKVKKYWAVVKIPS